MVDAYADGIITKDDCLKRAAALDQQARELRALLPVKAPAIDGRRMVKTLGEFFAGFEKRPFEKQREALRKAFQPFVVQNGTIPAPG